MYSFHKKLSVESERHGHGSIIETLEIIIIIIMYTVLANIQATCRMDILCQLSDLDSSLGLFS